EIRITDTQKKLGCLHAHVGEITKGYVKIGDPLTLSVDRENRGRLRANHSATHLLHAALRRTLGEHVTQKGSLVAADKLRFDFSHPQAITPAQMTVIEAIVNDRICANSETRTRILTPDQAVAEGAM